MVLTEGQLAALEKAQTDKEAHGEFESECPGYCGAQDTFYVGKMKGVGRIYQQTFIDTSSKVALAKLSDRKTPLTAADLLNDRVVPFFDAYEVKLSRVLTDRGTEYCGNPERHEYELYLALEDVDHSRTKTKSPQTNRGQFRLHTGLMVPFGDGHQGYPTPKSTSASYLSGECWLSAEFLTAPETCRCPRSLPSCRMPGKLLDQSGKSHSRP